MSFERVATEEVWSGRFTSAHNAQFRHDDGEVVDREIISHPGAVAVVAQQLRGPERDAVWKRITAAVPRFAQYQEKTDRELPVIRLTPKSQG